MDPVLMRRLAKPLLFSAAFIWGTSFFIMKNTLDAVPVLWLLTFRFTTGAVLVGLLCGRKWRTRFTPDYVWRGAVLGSLLFAAYAVQTFGLVGTTPSKNAFLTATYCVLVPFLHWAVSRQRPDRFHLLAAFLCITGVGLVSLSGSLTITWGDLLSLGSALFYALHIVAVNKLSDQRDIYLLTTLQFAFTALLAVIGGLLLQPFPRPGPLPARRVLAPGLPVCGVHHCRSALPERGPGVVRPLLRLGDPVPGVSIRGAILRAVLWRPRHPPAAGGLRADLHCGAVL